MAVDLLKSRNESLAARDRFYEKSFSAFDRQAFLNRKQKNRLLHLDAQKSAVDTREPPLETSFVVRSVRIHLGGTAFD